MISYVRIRGEAHSIATLEDIVVARGYMRSTGVERLPVLRGDGSYEREACTGLYLRAFVSGLVRVAGVPVPLTAVDGARASAVCVGCGEWIGNAASIAGACTGCGATVAS